MAARLPGLIACLALATVLTGGCQGSGERVPQQDRGRASLPSTAPGQAADEVEAVLAATGIATFYVMAGEDRLHAGFGTLDADGLRPTRLDPDPALISNIAGNGTTLVMGAAGLVPDSYTDGVYRVDGTALSELAGPDDRLYGPTVSSDGTVTAIRPLDGFWTRGPHSRRWVHDPRLAHKTLSPIVWAGEGTQLTVVHATRPAARLVVLRGRSPARTLGDAHCAASLLAAPGRGLVVTIPPDRKDPACQRAVVLDLHGRAHDEYPLPDGWTPLAWTHDAEALLMSKGTEVGVFSLDGDRLVGADVGVHLWMAVAAG